MTKPFARVEGNTLVIGDGFTLSVYEAGGSVEELAAAINGDVETREAKLRGPLQALLDSIDKTLAPFVTRTGEKTLTLRFREAFEALKGDGPVYVHGDVACGLAWDLGATQAKVEGSWGVLLDVMLDKGGEASEMAWQLAELVGLDRTKLAAIPPMFLSDAELRAECQRRGISRPGLPPTTLLDFARQGIEQPWQREIIDRLAAQEPADLVALVDEERLTGVEAARRSANRHMAQRVLVDERVDPPDDAQLRRYAEMLGAPLDLIRGESEPGRESDQPPERAPRPPSRRRRRP